MRASPQQIVAVLLATIGVGFLLANLRIAYQLLRFGRLRSSAPDSSSRHGKAAIGRERPCTP